MSRLDRDVSKKSENLIKERKEERRDNRAMVSIIRKSNGETVDHFSCAYDEAESKARSVISGKEDELKYRITMVGPVDK